MSYGPKGSGPRSTQDAIIAHMMRDFIARGRREPTKWWGAVWGISPTNLYTVAKRTGCSAAIDSVYRGGYIPLNGSVPTCLLNNGRGKPTRVSRIGAMMLRRAGMQDCERIAYQISNGKIILTPPRVP